MLSKQDYDNYLKQILDIEIEMARVYETCVAVTADEEVRRVCAVLLKQEKKHAELVEELMKLFTASA